MPRDSSAHRRSPRSSYSPRRRSHSSRDRSGERKHTSRKDLSPAQRNRDKSPKREVRYGNSKRDYHSPIELEKSSSQSPKRIRRARDDRSSEERVVRKRREAEKSVNNGEGNDHRRRRHKSRSPVPDPEPAVKDPGEIINDGIEDDSIAKMKAAEEALEAVQKEKPSFELSGKLAAETNRLRGVTLLFTEPSDARKPTVRWQLFVFKGGELLNDPLYIHRQTCYLFGRERRVADIPTDHPSCSKQHAVLQYREVVEEGSDGMTSKKVRPYLMDLGSTNKTFINDKEMEPQRYYQLFEKDTIKFGNSSREYVLLHENST